MVEVKEPSTYWEKVKGYFKVTVEKLKTKQATKRAEWAEFKQWKAEKAIIDKAENE